ncbi:FAD-dependent oxidoreductase [Pseudoduganella namucuonensis]|uniref:Flavin containing amine oxidoreductase n=1 Tax=Pseudoduganella namucuonensis TaxID=1035707 RepID=A0A1I7JGD3_9BURK|nr:FAD-dependent oxidoreductase [Pseudoduganella namucuonensis]SFU84228.1 Flavin containing amine oxidoreductase [Pseudoduganella namucuonensis]
MSYLSFDASAARPAAPAGSLRSAYSNWLIANNGGRYRATVKAQLTRANLRRQQAALTAASPGDAAGEAKIGTIGIVGGGFAGLFSGLILQSLGIDCELFESSDRVGGRISTWYSSDYSPHDKDKAGLYGEMGGMRLPQFSADMLPVQQLGLAVNAVLERNGMRDLQVYWRKFYYNSPAQRMRYNDMPTFTTAADAGLASFNFDQARGGNVPEVWFTEKTDANGQAYLPINQILGQVNQPFIDAINRSFAEGFAMLMEYDQYSMWDYLTTVFTLGDLQQYYDPAMGAKSDLLPWPVVSFLETTNVGTGMYSVSFVEMVIAVYDWGGSKNPYQPSDPNIYMLTVDKGMQCFPDACHAVLDLEDGVLPEDGKLAQIQVGMLPAEPGGPYSYTAPNLTPDARPPFHTAAARADAPQTAPRAPKRKQRVFLKHKVVGLQYDPTLYPGQGGMKVQLRDLATEDAPLVEKQYPYVISTLPNGAYLNGEFKTDLLERISFDKAQAIRECEYMPAFKAFLTFKTQFWAKLGERQDQGLGAASTDRPNRQIIYPSYGYDATGGVLQVYCWAQDAQKLGALDDRARVAECLKGIAYLYPDVDVEAEFSGYHDGKTTKTWFWDEHAGGGAFALFNPGQFKNIYPALLTPEFDGCLNFAGECCSVHHGWIVGALDSAYNAVYHVLQQAGAHDKIRRMEETWGGYAPPDISGDAATASRMEYAFRYNEVDRKASSVAPGAAASIYGDSDYEFTGQVPAFIADFDKAPQSMKRTAKDKQVLQMLNNQWGDNVALRARAEEGAPAKPGPAASAVERLEAIYYGNNFQTIPAPRFWLKDDDEFARQQVAGFMPNLLTAVSPQDVRDLIESADIRDAGALGPIENIDYVADYRKFLRACTVTPERYYLPKPIVFFTVSGEGELMPAAIQLEHSGELFTPGMPNAENAWLLAKMLTNCAGQTLHDVGFHQLLTHQICAMVSVALFSEEVFNPAGSPPSAFAFQEHPVFKLLRPHVSKALEFQQTIYNRDYHPGLPDFPATRQTNGAPGVYNLGFVYDLIFSCGRIGNYQLQDRIYNDTDFRFLELALPADATKRGVRDTPFSYPYVHDAALWYDAIAGFTGRFVDACYPGGDRAVADDVQLQRFFAKLIPAFNHVDGVTQARRFPAEVVTTGALKEVLAMFVWQFSVQHTVVNDGAYNQAAFVPNASTLMYAPPAGKPSSQWSADDVINCLPSNAVQYPSLGGMNFMDVQINASVTGQGPYPETVWGRMTLEPSIDVLQDSYAFGDTGLRAIVDNFYQETRNIGDAIALRQAKDVARYVALRPGATAIPQTVVFDLITPANVMNTIQT